MHNAAACSKYGQKFGFRKMFHFAGQKLKWLWCLQDENFLLRDVKFSQF